MLRLVGLRCCPPWPFTPAVAAVSAFEDHRLGGARPCWGRSLDPPDLHAGFPDATRSCGSNSGLDTCPLRRGCPPRALPARSSELPLMGLSKDRPSVVLLARESTPGSRPPVARWPASFGMRPRRPIRVPTSWFCTTSPVSSSLSGRVCCNAFPTLGFTTFRPAPPALPTLTSRPDARHPRLPVMRSCPSKPSLRAQQPAIVLANHHQRDVVRVNPVTRLDVHQPPCPPAVAVDPILGSCLPILSPPTRPQGFAPCTGPLLLAALPLRETRCFHGLG
jgi:hypothetical protein